MAYDKTKPANDGYLAEFPPDMREQLRAIIDDRIVDAFKLMGLSPGNLSGNIPVSNGTVNTNLNADKLDGYHASSFATASHTHSVATSSSNGLMSNADYTKLQGVATGAEVNQNAFSNVKVGNTSIQADSKSDTLEIVDGANITVTPDATNDRLTIAVTGTVPNATTAAACTGNAATATTAAACSGNAATATTAKACTGNAATATKLATARTIALTGDVTGSATFDGSANANIPLTLINSGVKAGTYRSVTVDSKGRVTGGTNPTTLADFGIKDAINSSSTFTTYAYTGGNTGKAGKTFSKFSTNQIVTLDTLLRQLMQASHYHYCSDCSDDSDNSDD